MREDTSSKDPFLADWTYSDRSFFDRELKCFHESWQLFCHSSELIGGRLMQSWADSVLTVSRQGAGYNALYEASSGSVEGQVSLVEGFIFVRQRGNGPSAAEQFSPFLEELRDHQVPTSQPLTSSEEQIIEVNWKRLMEIALDDTHIPVVHPELAYFMKGAQGYRAHMNVRRWEHELSSEAVKKWVAIAYVKLLSLCASAVGKKNKWIFFWVFPACEIELMPEQISYVQLIPLSPTRTLQRSRFLGPLTRDSSVHLLRRLSHSIWRHIDAQDIACVLKAAVKQVSIEGFKKTPAEGDGLVVKFHQMILNATEEKN